MADGGGWSSGAGCGRGGKIDGVQREGLRGNARIAGEGVWRERRCSCVELGLQVDRWARVGEIERWRGERWGVVEGRSVSVMRGGKKPRTHER